MKPDSLKSIYLEVEKTCLKNHFLTEHSKVIPKNREAYKYFLKTNIKNRTIACLYVRIGNDPFFLSIF